MLKYLFVTKHKTIQCNYSAWEEANSKMLLMMSKSIILHQCETTTIRARMMKLTSNHTSKKQ